MQRRLCLDIISFVGWKLVVFSLFCWNDRFLYIQACTLCHGTNSIPHPNDIALPGKSKCLDVAMEALLSETSPDHCISYYQYIGYTKCGCDPPATTSGAGCSLCPNGGQVTLPDAQIDVVTGTTCSQAEDFLRIFDINHESCASFQEDALERCGCFSDNEPPQQQTTCRDDPNFRLLINVEKNRWEPCSWIDDAFGEGDVLFRRSKQCWKPDVKAACRRACGECCGDNKSHSFDVFVNNELQSVGCDWLTENPAMCDIKKATCPDSCGECIYPTNPPAVSPIASPTLKPTKNPTAKPTTSPTASPTANPTKVPTRLPTSKPTKDPTVRPAVKPSMAPTRAPTSSPSKGPSVSPSLSPTEKTSRNPTINPTNGPTGLPTPKPTEGPTVRPTAYPTKIPTNSPTPMPSSDHSLHPSDIPSIQPSQRHSYIPSIAISKVPSVRPSEVISMSPSAISSTIPSISRKPSSIPSPNPSNIPSNLPSNIPSDVPSTTKSATPTISTIPSNAPSFTPIPTLITMQPSISPSISSYPSISPTFLPSFSPSSLYETKSNCTALAAGVMPRLPAGVETYELAYTLDVLVANLVKVENIINGLETTLTKIASIAATCPDENEVYAISSLPLKDKNIHYSQFTDMEKKNEKKCANNDDIPPNYKCEVIEGKIKMFFSSNQISLRRLSQSESMEKIIIELLEYSVGKAAEEDILVSALAVKDVNNGGNTNSQVKQPTSELTSLTSKPIFFASIAVAAGVILMTIGFTVVRRKRGNCRTYDKLDSNPYGILPRTYPKSDFEGNRYAEVESVSDEELQTQLGQIGGFNAEDIDSFEIKSGFGDENVEQWMDSVNAYQDAYERLNLSSIVQACSVDIESVSSKSGVFDNISDSGSTGEI